MKKILITGATGNVGMEVIKSLAMLNHTNQVYLGVRNVQADKQKLQNFNAQLLPFDFTNCDTFQSALTDIDILFLLRPPQISEVKKYFKPLIDSAVKNGVKHIVFLSVQVVVQSGCKVLHEVSRSQKSIRNFTCYY